VPLQIERRVEAVMLKEVLFSGGTASRIPDRLVIGLPPRANDHGPRELVSGSSLPQVAVSNVADV
jgi:hypothetical protein